jgi:hypothetical protein
MMTVDNDTELFLFLSGMVNFPFSRGLEVCPAFYSVIWSVEIRSSHPNTVPEWQVVK